MEEKTFMNFTDFGMIVNVFLLPYSIFHLSSLKTCMINSHGHFIALFEYFKREMS